MNILILNITLNWVYKLYKEYILSIKDFIDKYYNNYLIDIYNNSYNNSNSNSYSNSNSNSNSKYDSNSKNINIEIVFIELYNDSIKLCSTIEETLNKLIKLNNNDLHLDINNYDKIFYSGNIEILNELLKQYSDKIYYINIEQMSHPSYYKMIRQIIGLKNIIDYSEENLPYFQNTYNTYLLPPYFKFNKDVKKSIKCIDLLSIVNNSYREKFISKIKITAKQKIRLLKNCFDYVRDDYYSKTKIYINLHCSSEHNTMEMIRLVNLIMNKVIILTQPSICTNLIFLKKYLFVCNDADEFTLKIQDILNNYDLYYTKIYGDFNKAEYQNYLLECYNQFVDCLSQ